ncbi:MAG: hypothetical protein IT203_02895, partial [Fimbriimonadaceae bacterium]|nr:hypothetical protein [Fimbriimonadaceae bacterium]
IKAMIQGLSPRIDFEAEIDWREIGSLANGIPGLYLEFADDSASLPDKHRFETPFGSVERLPEERQDVPTLRYAHIAGGRMTILQDSKYGHEVISGAVRPRVVRSSFDPDHAPEVAKSKMRYSIVFHEAPPTPAELTRLGADWNHPLIVMSATLQDGDMPVSKTFAEVKTASVVLSTIKPAEDGNGLILRLVEYNGAEAEAEVALAPEMVAGFTHAEVCDLMERPTGEAAKLVGTVLRTKVKANSLVTVRLS